VPAETDEVYQVKVTIDFWLTTSLDVKIMVAADGTNAASTGTLGAIGLG